MVQVDSMPEPTIENRWSYPHATLLWMCADEKASSIFDIPIAFYPINVDHKCSLLFVPQYICRKTDDFCLHFFTKPCVSLVEYTVLHLPIVYDYNHLWPSFPWQTLHCLPALTGSLRRWSSISKRCLALVSAAWGVGVYIKIAGINGINTSSAAQGGGGSFRIGNL